MNIAIDCRSLQLSGSVSGTGVYITNLLQALSLIDHKNNYTLLSVKDREPLKLNLHRDFRYSFHPLGCPFIEHLNIVRDRLFLKNEIEKLNPDVIHLPSPMELKTNPDMGSFNNRTVMTVLDITPLKFPSHVFIGKRMFLKPVYLSAIGVLPKSAHLITISKNTSEDVIKYLSIPPEKVSVTYLGKSGIFKVIDDADRLDLIRRSYNLPHRFVLYLGGFGLHKNLQRLLEAFDLMANLEAMSNVTPLVIAGKIDVFFMKSLREIIRQKRLEERVVFPGFIPDEHLPALYNLAELLVFPSLYEGFGLPLLEAMACGTPCACSDRSSLPEVGGEGALYFNPEDPMDMARTIDKILKDRELARELGKNALIQAGKFSWEKTAKGTLEVYEKIGGGSH